MCYFFLSFRSLYLNRKIKSNCNNIYVAYFNKNKAMCIKICSRIWTQQEKALSSIKNHYIVDLNIWIWSNKLISRPWVLRKYYRTKQDLNINVCIKEVFCACLRNNNVLKGFVELFGINRKQEHPPRGHPSRGEVEEKPLRDVSQPSLWCKMRDSNQAQCS